MYSLPPCAHVAGEPHHARPMKAHQVGVIVVVYAFVTWMIYRGFTPSMAVLTAAAVLAVSVTPASLMRYRTASWLRHAALALESGRDVAIGPVR